MCVTRGDSGWEAGEVGAAREVSSFLTAGDDGMEEGDIMEGCITGEEICSGSGLCVAATADGVGCGE